MKKEVFNVLKTKKVVIAIMVVSLLIGFLLIYFLVYSPGLRAKCERDFANGYFLDKSKKYSNPTDIRNQYQDAFSRCTTYYHQLQSKQFVDPSLTYPK